jgi:hypothetical protein
MYFENLSYSETVIENPKEKDPAKVITRVERYHMPNYLRARCIFFKKFLEDKKNDGEDLNYESFYMGLTLDGFMAWKAEAMTMNTASPHVAKSRDLVVDFKKGIKQDPSLFPSLKHIDNWPTLNMRLWLKHLLRTLSTYLTQSTNHGAVRRKIYLQ